MGTKRKASGKSKSAAETSDWNEKGGKLPPINSYEDIADSEDEFHITRDKIMLDEGPDAKKRRKIEEEDALLDASDIEILGYDESDDEEEVASEDDKNNDEDEVDDEEIGGYEKKEYYGADTITTEAEARAVEEEARRLQQKNLQKMSAADFGFDEDEWLDSENKADGEKENSDVVTEALTVQQITADMTEEERLTIMQLRYPEYELLASEAVRLRPVFLELKAQAEEEKSKVASGAVPRTTAVVKYRALGAYLACVGMYFAILTSPVRDSDSTQLLDPAELRDHPVIDSIFRCRELWEKAEMLQDTQVLEEESEGDSFVAATSEPEHVVETKQSRKQNILEATKIQAAALRQQRIDAVEQSLSGLSELMPKSRKPFKTSKAIVFSDDDNNSDFGEEENLSAKAAAEKAKKRKSLQFYTSQVVQKANKRAGAGRDAGGDLDLPHKERLRDRQERLNAEAAARGKKLDEYGRGADLGGESEDEDAPANGAAGEDDEYYDMVSKLSKKKKQDKSDKYDAIRKAKEEGGLARIVEGEVDADGKRAIGYVIEKNKGLAPKRKKDVRNPRVKKRMKFEAKKKKLASMRATYKGGEERGGYGGEKTGIKPGLVKSIKL